MLTTHDTEITGAAREGVMAITPLVIGFAPFALAVGATIGGSSDHAAGIAGSWLIYGGSAQIATVRTLESGGAVLAVLTALLIQSRLLVYSASLAQHWVDQPRWFRVTAAAMLVDPVWAVAEARALQPESPRAQRAHYFAAAITIGIAWAAFVIVGVLLGSRVGGSQLQVAAPLCLLALLGPRLLEARTRPIVIAAAAAAIASRGFPSGTAIFVAVFAGCAVGQVIDRRTVDGAKP